MLRRSAETGLVEIVGEAPASLVACGPAPANKAEVLIEHINTLHADATELAGQARAMGECATRKAIMAGLKLAALKEATPHGQWESLFSSGQKRVKSSNGDRGRHLLNFSRDTARNYIAVAANMMAQRLSGEQSEALMQLAWREEGEDLSAHEISFLDDVTPEKSLRQLYLNLGIVKPTRRELYAMGAEEDAAGRMPDPPRPDRPPTLTEQMAMKRSDAREYWFGSQQPGMVGRGALLHRLMQEAKHPVESQLNFLTKPDLAEVESTLRELLKIVKTIGSKS